MRRIGLRCGRGPRGASSRRPSLPVGVARLWLRVSREWQLEPLVALVRCGKPIQGAQLGQERSKTRAVGGFLAHRVALRVTLEHQRRQMVQPAQVLRLAQQADPIAIQLEVLERRAVRLHHT
eukprot:scaffold311798_cov22-Tisochrysis_lutea.AAC.2